MSEPIGVVPSDPTEDPLFECPGIDATFCYPDGTATSASFLWLESDYIPEQLSPFESAERLSSVVADWWDWYWDDESDGIEPSSDDTSNDEAANEPRAEPGDANSDGVFNQLDIIAVLQLAKYNTRTAAVWAEGDWTGDGLFDQYDIIAALQLGHYLMDD